jgi:hypothetical protein
VSALVEVPPDVEGTAAPSTDVELTAWIEEHRVCWETITHREVGPHGLVTVGYDVVLLARCMGPGPWDPGGARAAALYEGLQQLAARVTPADAEDEVAVAPYEPMFQVRAQSNWQPEVRLTLEIRHDLHHDRDYFGAIDDDERTCVRRVEQALGAWGARAGEWWSSSVRS